MNMLLWITQAILFIFFAEEILKKNKAWYTIISHFKNGVDIFLNWRSQADILEEFKIIPILFKKIGGYSFILLIILLFFKITNSYIMFLLLSILLFSLVAIFSFNWVLYHRETIKEFKPVIYIYGIILIGIAISLYYKPIYPETMIAMSHKYHILLPDKFELLLKSFYMFIAILFFYYLVIWGFALIIPSSILLILFLTSKISIFLKKYINKSTLIGIMSIIQLLVFYGFYMNS